MADPIELVCCYAREDETGLQALLDHLKPLERVGEIRVWHDRQIMVGSKWEEAIDTHLDSANIILLLISSSFMASDYCYSHEMERALERQKRGEARVVPVIFRHCAWQITPIGKLQALPTDGKPISDRKSWDNPDSALLNVFEGVHTVVIELRIQALMREAETLCQAKKYLEALSIYDQAFLLYQAIKQPNNQQQTMLALLYQGQADIFYVMKDLLVEALQGYTLALELDATLARSIERKGYILFDLERYEEALPFLSRVMRQNPGNQRVPPVKLDALLALKREQEALEFCEQIQPRFPDALPIQSRIARIFQEYGCYEQALIALERVIFLSPGAASYQQKAEVLETLQRYREALEVYQKIEEIKTDDPLVFLRKGHLLARLWRYQEALEAYDQAIRLNPQLAEAYFGKRGVYEALSRNFAAQARKLEKKDGLYHGQFQLAHTLRGHTGWITCLAFSSDWNTLVSGSHDKTIKIWDLASEREARLLTAYSQAARDIALSPDGSIVAACWADGTLSAWDSDTGKKYFTLSEDGITSIAFSHERDRCLFGSCGSGIIKMWDLSGRLFSVLLTLHKGAIMRIALSPTNAILASSGEDTSIKLWKLSSKEEIAVLANEHTSPVWSLFFSSDERTLFSASNEQMLLWDIASRNVVCRVPTNGQKIQCCAVSANGRWLACGLADNTIKIWHLALWYRAIEPEPLILSAVSARDLTLSHNGRILIGGLEDGTIKIWMRE